MNKIFNLKIDASGLSLFRIFYCIILFFEIKQLFIFRNVIYDKQPFIVTGELDVSFLFYFWFVIVICLIVGFRTRFAAIINYIFSVIIFSSATDFEYHVFYVYVGINFLLIFMPVSRVLSFDNLLQKLKYSNSTKTYKVDSKVLQINYLIPVFVGIGLVYIDSVFHKLSSKLWLDGLGVWLPSSLPMITWNDTSFLLNQEWAVKFLSYLVLVFEAVFIFLFWIKRFRMPFFILGVFFHIGILIAYPIPYFALAYIAIYLLMVPVSLWKKISDKFKFSTALYTFYYDGECPLCQKVVLIIKHFDIFKSVNCKTVQNNYQENPALKDLDENSLLTNIHGVNSDGKIAVGYWAYVQLFRYLLYTYPLGLLLSIKGISNLGVKVYNYIADNRLTERCTLQSCPVPVYCEPSGEKQDFFIKGLNRVYLTQVFWKGIIITVILGQLFMIWYSPTVQHYIPLKNRLNKIVDIPYQNSQWVLKKYLGITSHTVFLNEHFEGFNHIFKITYFVNNKEKEVPILDNDGMPAEYVSGSIWRNISFNVVTQKIEKEKFEKGILPYLKYYCKDNDISLGDFNFYVKEIQIPDKWEKDFLIKQIRQPWQKVGKCKIVKDSLDFYWNQRMSNILNDEADSK